MSGAHAEATGRCFAGTPVAKPFGSFVPVDGPDAAPPRGPSGVDVGLRSESALEASLDVFPPHAMMANASVPETRSTKDEGEGSDRFMEARSSNARAFDETHG